MSLISQMYYDKKREVSLAGKVPDTKKIFSFAIGYAFDNHGGKLGFNNINELKSVFSKWRKARKKLSKAPST